MLFGALKMISSTYGGDGPQRGRVGICLTGICEDSTLSPCWKPALCDAGIVNSNGVVAAFISRYIVVVSQIACSLIYIHASHCLLFDQASRSQSPVAA